MKLDTRLTRLCLQQLVASPAGRAHLLNQCADAEASDEGAIFDHLLEGLDDPELRRLVRRHQEDELRHADMFRACMARTGVTPPPVPEHLKLLVRLDRALGGRMATPVRTRTDVMQMYLVLQVIEERATTQFPMHIEAYRAVDPETARVVASIADDETRHLRYCHAIARRFAPDPQTHASELSRLRAVEARAFAANSSANMAYIRDQGLVGSGPLAKLFWRGVQAISSTRGEMRTSFWGEPIAA